MSDDMSKEEKEYMKHIRNTMNTELVDDELTKLCVSIEGRFDKQSIMCIHHYDYRRNTIEFSLCDVRDNYNHMEIKTAFNTTDIIDFDIFVGQVYGSALDLVTEAFVEELTLMYGLIVLTQQPDESEIEL